MGKGMKLLSWRMMRRRVNYLSGLHPRPQKYILLASLNTLRLPTPSNPLYVGILLSKTVTMMLALSRTILH